MTADAAFMRQAIRLAQTAGDRGDMPVGSIVVRDGCVVGEGIESVRAERDPAGHAEVKAVQQACRNMNTLDLTGCSLFTTVEPCFMCSYVIRSTRISRVVIGRAAHHIGGSTSKYPILTAPDIPSWRQPPLVVSGMLENECSA
ncbi:MAG: nucleoside deaminase [Terracidiphilus sp.]